MSCQVGIRWLSPYFPTLHQLSFGLLFLAPCRIDLHLVIGKTLSQFRITAKLGEGGMGDVYRARDKQLDRDVAIKVLPPEFTTDAERLARFEREAKLLASLNHPNIAVVYSFESSVVSHQPEARGMP